MKVLAAAALGFLMNDSSEPPVLRPYLRWELASRPMPGGGGVWYFQDSVSWVDGRGGATWTRRLPERMRRAQAGMGEAEMEAYRLAPRETWHLAFLIGLVETDGAIVVGDGSGLLALAKADGATLLDFNAEAETAGSKERFWFDSGTYEVSGADSCRGEARGARLLARCGQRLLYFNGSSLALVTEKDWKVAARLRYEPRRHDLPERRAAKAARLPLADLVVTLRGVIHLR